LITNLKDNIAKIFTVLNNFHYDIYIYARKITGTKHVCGSTEYGFKVLSKPATSGTLKVKRLESQII